MSWIQPSQILHNDCVLWNNYIHAKTAKLQKGMAFTMPRHHDKAFVLILWACTFYALSFAHILLVIFSSHNNVMYMNRLSVVWISLLETQNIHISMASQLCKTHDVEMQQLHAYNNYHYTNKLCWTKKCWYKHTCVNVNCCMPPSVWNE